MRAPRASEEATTTAGVTYAERLTVPWWWWPLAVVIVSGTIEAMVAGPHFAGGGWLAEAVAAVASATVVVVALARLSAARVEVRDGALHAGGSVLPATSIASVSAMDRERTRRVMGPLAHHAAFLYTRGWVTTAVRVDVRAGMDRADEGQRAPYWVVSSRRPRELAAAIATLRSGIDEHGVTGPTATDVAEDS